MMVNISLPCAVLYGKNLSDGLIPQRIVPFSERHNPTEKYLSV